MSASDPYPWPFDGGAVLDVARTMVVACGMQRHWLAMLPVPEAAAAVREVVHELRSRGLAVLWVRHGRIATGSRPIDRTLPVVGSPDWELLDVPEPDDVVIDTPGHDAFLVAWTEAELRARGVDRLVFVGLGTESVVTGTLRSANDRGFECITLTDAVGHHDPRLGAAMLSSITMSGGIFGAVGPSEYLTRS